jgi:hypothetical protein
VNGLLSNISDWKKQAGHTLPLVIVARIVGVKSANYFNELWNKDDVSRERVKAWIREAEDRFNDICV